MKVVVWTIINPKDLCSSGPANHPRCDNLCNDLSCRQRVSCCSLGSGASLRMRDSCGSERCGCLYRFADASKPATLSENSPILTMTSRRAAPKRTKNSISCRFIYARLCGDRALADPHRRRVANCCGSGRGPRARLLAPSASATRLRQHTRDFLSSAHTESEPSIKADASAIYVGSGLG
jgi:hypothetical protein